jgi:hypothetical protein
MVFDRHRDQGRDPELQHRGRLSLGEAPGPPRSRGASPVFCPIIRRVCGSALSYPRGILQSRLAVLRDITPWPTICPVWRAASPLVIRGRRLGLPPHHRGEMRIQKDLPRVLLSVPFHGGAMPQVAVTHTLDSKPGHPGVSRQRVCSYTFLSGHQWRSRDLSCQREVAMREVLGCREDAEEHREARQHRNRQGEGSHRLHHQHAPAL